MNLLEGNGEPDKIQLEKYIVRAEGTKFSIRMKGTGSRVIQVLLSPTVAVSPRNGYSLSLQRG